MKKVTKQQKEDSTAKAELDDVLANAQKHVKDLESHIKKGEKLIEKKERELGELEGNINATDSVDVKLAKEGNNIKKIEKEEKEEKKTSEEDASKKKSLEDKSIKEIKHEADKNLVKVNKNQDKAHKA